MSLDKLNLIKIITDGREFVTSKDTLMRCPYFENFFSETSDSSTDGATSTVHVDCLAEAFEHILEYLRFPAYRIPDKYYYLCDFLFMDKNPLLVAQKTPGTLCYYVHHTLIILDAPTKERIRNVTYFKDIYKLSKDILLDNDQYIDGVYKLFLIVLEKSYNETAQNIFNRELIDRFGLYYGTIEESMLDLKGAELHPFFYDHPDSDKSITSKHLRVSNVYIVKIVKVISKTEHSKTFSDNVILKLVKLFHEEINQNRWSNFVTYFNDFFREAIHILESHERWYEIKYRPYKY